MCGVGPGFRRVFRQCPIVLAGVTAPVNSSLNFKGNFDVLIKEHQRGHSSAAPGAAAPGLAIAGADTVPGDPGHFALRPAHSPPDERMECAQAHCTASALGTYSFASTLRSDSHGQHRRPRNRD